MVFAKRKYIVVVESFDCRLLETNKKKKQRFFCDLMQCSFFFFCFRCCLVCHGCFMIVCSEGYSDDKNLYDH